MNYGNLKHILGVFSFQNSISNGIFIIKYTWVGPTIRAKSHQRVFWCSLHQTHFTLPDHNSIFIPPQVRACLCLALTSFHMQSLIGAQPTCAAPTLETSFLRRCTNLPPWPLSQLFHPSKGILYIWAWFIHLIYW